MDLPYAEDINYWKTGKSTPDTWLERTTKLVEGFGGVVNISAFGTDSTTGRKAYLFAFEIKGDYYKVVWPVLPTYYENSSEIAAKRQAATMLHHDIKAKLMRAEVFGHRSAFFQYMVLPDGRTAEEASIDELQEGIPALFRGITQNLIEG